MDNFIVHELVGEGSFGRVFKGSPRSSPEETVALKLIPKVGHSEREIKSLRSECKIQKELSHPNIVQMLDAFETQKELIAVTEFIPGGDLHRAFSQAKAKSGSFFSEERVRDLGGDLISACCYLHSHRVLHRDIKPQNVLLSETGTAKLCDFGFARNLGLNTFVLTSIKGTPLYMAPELIEERPYDASADLWSVGCILYELLVGVPPFSTNSLFQLIKKVRYECVDWSHSNAWSANCLSFLRGLLEKDPKKRLGWPALLSHPFMEGRLNLFGCEPSFLCLSESQELAKEIQREDCSKLTGGSSQTLLLLAQRYENEKKALIQRRRYSEVGLLPQDKNHMSRRPSDVTAANAVLSNAHYISPPPPLVVNNINHNVHNMNIQALNDVSISTIESIIKMPDRGDEISWIEYLNDKIKDEESSLEPSDFLKLCVECNRSPICLERLSVLLMKDFSLEHLLQDDHIIEEIYQILEHLLNVIPSEIDEEELMNSLRVAELFFLILLRISLLAPASLTSSRFLKSNDSNNNGPFLIRDALRLSFELGVNNLSSTVLDLLNVLLQSSGKKTKEMNMITNVLLIGEDETFMEMGFAKEPARYGSAVYRIWSLLQEGDLKDKTTSHLLSAAPKQTNDPCLKKIISLLCS